MVSKTTFTKVILSFLTGEGFEQIEGDFELVSNDARQVKVRNAELSIEHDIQKYKEKGIENQDFDNPLNLIDYQSLVRYLEEENPETFKATQQELRTSIPNDLPLLMKIDSWHHKSYSEYDGDKPSGYETFKLIAEVLTSKNTEKWQPTLAPNNHWKNWPEAGGL